MKESNWTEKELKYLVKHWHRVTNKEIAEKLGKTESAVRMKVTSYITFDMMKKRRWSDYERSILQKLYGTMSIEELSNRMKRSVRSIQEEVKCLEGTFNVALLRGLYKTTDVAGFLGITQASVYRRIKRGEIPFYKMGKHNVINQDVFWNWLKDNLDQPNYKTVKEEFELDSPEWYKKVIKEKKRELRDMRNNEEWTSKEDALLWSEMMKQTPYNIIAEQLKRGKWAINHRASYLSKKKMGKFS